MQTADQMLTAIRKLGRKRLPLTRVYRCLLNEDLFLLAYSNLAQNRGALTPGPDDDTADGMSLRRIRRIIADLRTERFHPRPARRVHIPKRNGGSRPLGMPNFSEKLVQEVLRMVLTAYYEPRFRRSSHGFRPDRGCHTALITVKHLFQGTAWFIEGDIRGAFDNLDHTVLMTMLARDITDGRLLTLIRRHLQAGVLDQWTYHDTYSGTPQGGVLSPLLSNIYFHALDTFVEDILIPQWTRGRHRRLNPAYKRLEWPITRARARGDRATLRTLLQQRRTLPSSDRRDPGYRRLRYVRYADDFILGFSGPRDEAVVIKEQLRVFLRDELKLDLHPEKTHITHGMTDYAQFLGHAVSIYLADHKQTRRNGTGPKVRSINSQVRLGLPSGRIAALVHPYRSGGKVQSIRYLTDDSVPNILRIFQSRFRGIAEYYKYAVDRHELHTVAHVMEIALVKTLAHKLRISVKQVYRRYRSTLTIDNHDYPILQVTIATEKGPRQYHWGGIPLKVVDPDTQAAIVDDRTHFDQYLYHEHRTDVVARLQANQCEMCGSTEDCEVHHIRKLANLKKRWAGRTTKPPWVSKMIALRRKTLVVCDRCHHDIHEGRISQRRTEC